MLLDTIVADGRGGAEPFLDVARLENVPLFRRPAPDPREAIGLQLQPHRQRVRLIRIGLLQLAHLVRDAEDLLHVVADLVGDHIGLREVAGSPEAPPQFLVEAKIDVDLLVGRAIERAHRALGEAATRTNGVREQHQLGVAVLMAGGGQQFVPHRLGIVEHERHELHHLVVGGRGLVWRRGRSTAVVVASVPAQ